MEMKLLFIISLILAFLFIVWINKPDKEKSVYVSNEKKLNFKYTLNICLVSGEIIETILYSNHYYLSAIDIIEHCSIMNVFEKSKFKILKICSCEDEVLYIPLDKIIKLRVFTERSH